MSRVFLPLQLSTPDGLPKIINVASSGALTARPGSDSYHSSKLVILRWTETLQLEYGDQGLLAFCVNLGAIKTKITEAAPNEVRNRFLDRLEVAGDTIAWLGAERREWLAGRYMSCTWDMEELSRKNEENVGEDKLKMRMAF
ncbi:hypothetical protein G6011_03802 [Alternaria panax]|uniref:Uncharacterized protein n=1 Tax=Alternaria panax TaxID=48097 RepID=A0AAD4IFC1_9PLEO|nr:hypothetical protein G6011_03802 [Alternaria panax]